MSAHAHLTTRCLPHVATSTLLTNCPESKPSVLHAFTNSRPRLSDADSRSPRNNQNVPSARVTLGSVRTRLSDVARLPCCTQPSIAWSCQPTCPTHASSPLTNFPKRESRHPTHPCPRISVVRTSRPHVHESVATVARTPSHPSCPRTHVHAMTHLGHEPILEKKS